MGELAALADVITPNRTEAALLLGEDCESISLKTEADCRRWAEALSLDGRRSVVLTGVSLEPGRVGAACFDRDTGCTDFASPSGPGAVPRHRGPLFQRPRRGAGQRAEPH